MTATILGSGTSMGVPPIGWDPPDDWAAEPKNYRLRAGLLIREKDADPQTARGFIVDCGPDFRQQAMSHKIYRIDGMLLTHSHFDHVAGLDDVRIYNFRQGQSLPLFGSDSALADIRKRFDYVFNPPQKGGGVASLDLTEITGPFEFLGMRIIPIPVKHGIIDVLGFRFGDFVYVTDASYISPESLDLMRGCRTLILNALRPEPHSTHFSLGQAVDIAKEIGAANTWFVHMTHFLEHRSTNASLPPGMSLSWDGLSFDFMPEYVKGDS